MSFSVQCSVYLNSTNIRVATPNCADTARYSPRVSPAKATVCLTSAFRRCPFSHSRNCRNSSFSSFITRSVRSLAGLQEQGADRPAIAVAGVSGSRGRNRLLRCFRLLRFRISRSVCSRRPCLLRSAAHCGTGGCLGSRRLLILTDAFSARCVRRGTAGANPFEPFRGIVPVDVELAGAALLALSR